MTELEIIGLALFATVGLFAAVFGALWIVTLPFRIIAAVTQGELRARHIAKPRGRWDWLKDWRLL